MVQILELFGGIGSPRCALRNIGIPVKAIDYVEIDEKAVRSYNAMFANELEYKTQSVVGWNLKPDILIHGSPCQDFSIAGHQKGADEGSETRSSLMWETIHIIEQMGEWKPKTLILEPDAKGLFVAADLSKTDLARGLYQDIDAGMITKMSWAFTVAEESYDRETHTRTILKIKKVYDVSAVSIPANNDTEISARNFANRSYEQEKQELLKRRAMILKIKASL